MSTLFFSNWLIEMYFFPRIFWRFLGNFSKIAINFLTVFRAPFENYRKTLCVSGSGSKLSKNLVHKLMFSTISKTATFLSILAKLLEFSEKWSRKESLQLNYKQISFDNFRRVLEKLPKNSLRFSKSCLRIVKKFWEISKFRWSNSKK